MLERPGKSISSHTACLGFGTDMELALFRAREAMLAGWQFTPEEALAYTGAASFGSSSPVATAQNEIEDEIEDLPLYFSET